MKPEENRRNTSSFSDCPEPELGNEVSDDRFAHRYPLRILVAEDNYICRRVMVIFLQRLGYAPAYVDNGQHCMDEALKGSYDLILSDIDMPEMGGLECARELRKAGSSSYIVAVTASSIATTRESCQRAGMDEFLPKPFDGPQLKGVLRDSFHAVSQRHSRQN
jgi:CheY-like chemotaxis protein